MRRIIIVMLGLMATGSAIGAVLGAVSLWVATAILGVGPNVGSAALLAAGAKAGALTGTVLAPISALALMRHVPLWRAIAALIGGGLAWSILGAPIGFLIAAVRLRMAYGARRTQKESSRAAKEAPNEGER